MEKLQNILRTWCALSGILAFTACSAPKSQNQSTGSSKATVGEVLDSHAGGDSSGGGNAVRSPVTGKFVLLDYLASAPDTYLNFVNQPGSPLVLSNQEADSTVAPYPYTTLAYQQLALQLFTERMGKWSATEPECFLELERNAVYWTWFAKPDLQQGGRIFVPENMLDIMRPLEILPVVYYMDDHYRYLYISEASYNQMDLYSQAGLFVHESLRMIKNYGVGCPMKDGTHFMPTDKQIQEWTVKIMFTDPN